MIGARIASPSIFALASVAALTLLAIPWPQNLYLTGALAALVVGLVAPPAALGLLVASVPIQAVGSVAFGPVELTVTKTLLAATVAAWLLRVALSGCAPKVEWPAFVLAIYVLALTASVVNAGSAGDWAGEVYRWTSALVVYVVASDVIRDVGAARPELLGMAGGTIGASLFGLYQVAVGSGPASFSVGGITRAYATFGEPNPLAGYLELTVPLLIAVSGCALAAARSRTMIVSDGWVEIPRQARQEDVDGLLVAICAVAAALGLAALVLTQSRGGWIGAVVGIGVVVWLIGGWVRWASVAVAVVGVGLVVATPVGARVVARAGDGIVPRLGAVQVTTANFAVQERLAHWRAGIEMARRHPFLGVGAGNFTANFRDATRVWRFRISRGHAHNAYIQAAAQAGSIGLAAYLAFVAAAGARLVGALRRAGNGAARPLVIGTIGAGAALAIHNVFDYLHVLSLGVQLSVVLALAGAEGVRKGMITA